MKGTESDLVPHSGRKELGLRVLKDEPDPLAEGVIEPVFIEALFIQHMPKGLDDSVAGKTRPFRILSNVDLPDPFAPSSTIFSRS